MREHDDTPTIIIEREGGSGVGPFILGALVGAGLALLFAPKSGAETQEELREGARRLKATAEEKVRAAQRQLEERLDAAREGVQSKVGELRDAMDAGRAAALDARSEMERKLERSKAAYRAGIEAARKAAAEEPADGAVTASPAGNGDEEVKG